jgi:hypothetical protein
MSRSSTRAHSHNGASAQPQPPPVPRQQSSEPDVYLNVPDLQVDEIELDVENLEAHLALQARLANLLELRAGAHVAVEKVQLDIKGVAALGPGGVVDETIEGVSRTVSSGPSRGKLARLGGSLRSLGRGTRGDHRVTKVATAAGLLGGAALAAHNNGDIEKTIKDLTSDPGTRHRDRGPHCRARASVPLAPSHAHVRGRRLPA